MSFKARNLLPYFYLSLPFFGFSVFAVGQRGIRIDWLIAIVFILLMTTQLVSGKLKSIKIDSVIISLFLLIFFVSLSIQSPLLSGNSQSLTDFFTTYLQFLIGTILFLFAYNLKLNDSDLKLILKCILLVSGFVSALAILQLFLSYFGYELRLPFTNPGRALQHSGYEAVTGPVQRSMGTFSEPRQLGAYLLTAISISVASLNGNLKLFNKRYLQGILFGLIVAGILCTLSTSAILTMFAFLFFFLFFKLFVRKNIFRKIILVRILLLFSILVLVGSAIYSSPIGTVIVDRIKLPEMGFLNRHFTEVEDKAHRWGAFVRGQRLGLEAFADYPISGVGLNNFQNFVKANYGDLIGPTGCHGPLRYLAQTGSLGIIGFGIFLLSLIVKLQKKRRRVVSMEQKEMLELGFLIIVVSFFACFGSGLYSLVSVFFWGNLVLVGLILNCYRENRVSCQLSAMKPSIFSTRAGGNSAT